MNRGDVVFVPDFSFPNGGHARKLLIVLWHDDASDTNYCVLTTSQKNGGRRRDPGCQPRRGEFFIQKNRGMPKDTWVLFHDKLLVLEDSALESICHVEDILPEQLVNAIVDCVVRTSTMLEPRQKENLEQSLPSFQD